MIAAACTFRNDTLRFHLCLFVSFAAVEATIFYFHVFGHLAPFYPQGFDQLVYYLDTYDIAAYLRSHGSTALLDTLWDHNSATGSTFALQGALLSLIGGANRPTFLTINLLYLFAAQLVVLLTIRDYSNAAFGWTAVALLTTTSTLFAPAGGLFDYRIDFSAMCLYGICISLFLWSGLFLYLNRALIAALACVLLIYSRFFTIIYIAGLLGTVLLIEIIRWKFAAKASQTISKLRVRNILICGLLIAAICLPRLYASRDAIYNYYMIGHVLGEEKFIRANELGIQGPLAHILYYPKSILQSHIGWLSFLTAGILFAFSMWLAPRSVTATFSAIKKSYFEFTFLLVAISTPILVLTTNISKSQVVGGVVTIPVILLFVLIGLSIWPSGVQFKCGGRMVNLAVFATAVALTSFSLRGISQPNVEYRTELNKITEMGVAIVTYAADKKLDTIMLSSDRVSDFANAALPRLFSIEKMHRNLKVGGLFGHGAHGIFATSQEEALQLFEKSDVIIMTDPEIDRSHPYPSNTKIKEYWPQLWQWSTSHRTKLYSTVIWGVPYYVFVRPVITPPPAE